MQSCVTNLILNKRYLNYDQYLADAVSFAEGMGRLAGLVLTSLPQVGAVTGVRELQSPLVLLRHTSV